MEALSKVKLDSEKNILKQIRQALGLTQEEFARAIKANRVSVARWENSRSPSLNIAQIKALEREMAKIGLRFADLPNDLN
jgi:transcriptional regulator with XRE-family HTH domain